MLVETLEDGSLRETNITDKVDFNGANPAALFEGRDGTAAYEGVYKGDVTAYYNGAALTDATSLVYIGVKGDANLDANVDISDASKVLTYYANSAAGLEAKLLDGADADYETLAYFLADVDTESTAGANSDAGKLEISDASNILTYYAQKAAGLAPEWDVIIPSLKTIVGSLWYDRANG